MTISRNSRLPLYAQIRQEIEQDITNKKLKPGDRLPSEDELAASFSVSRMTARRAVDQLVSRGMLIRKQGQGTFVIEQAVPPPPGGITRWSFERIDLHQGMSQSVLNVQELAPSLRVANALRTIPGETVVRITGQLISHGEPTGYFINYIPTLLAPNITAKRLENELMPNFLIRQYGLEFGKISERIRAIPADEESAELLNVKSGHPLLSVDSLVHLNSGIPVILSNTTYRHDSYVYRGLLHPIEL